MLVADTAEKARQLRKLADYNLSKFEKGLYEPMSSYNEIGDHVFSPDEEARNKI